jgi:hypothetical protein
MPKLTIELDKETMIKLKALAFNDETTEQKLVLAALKDFMYQAIESLTEHDDSYWKYLRKHGIKY